MIRLFVGVVCLASLLGCEARTQVARDKVLAQIDKMLGELDVKRKQITNKVGALDQAIEQVRKKKIQAEVQLQNYKDKLAPVQSRIDQIKETLGKLRPHLGATEDVVISGKTLTPEQIQETANILADEFQKLNRRLGGYESSVKAFQESYNLLAAQQANATKTMAMMKDKLDEIDAKKEAIDAMKVSQTILGESGSISDEFSDLEKQINDLFVDVETEMRLETEKISERERDLDSRSSSVDQILKDLESSDETAARIDEILGTGGEDKSDDN